MPLKAVIIGCGNVAGGYDAQPRDDWSLTHAGAYRLTPGVDVVAASDPDEIVRTAFCDKWDIGVGYENFADMLAEHTPDIASLCLPTEPHESAFAACINAGTRAILMEKPLAPDLDAARAIASRGRDLPVAVNYFRRWNPDIAQARKVIASGDRGKVLNVTVRYTKGVLVNGSHLIDLARWFFGEPESATYLRTAQPDAVDPGLDFRLDYSDGLAAYFLNVPDAGFVFIDMDIVCEGGRLVISQRGQHITWHEPGTDAEYGFAILEENASTETQWHDCITRALADLIVCIDTGNDPACTLTDGLRAQEICADVLAQSRS